jgi:hypothetical protein
VPAAAPCTEPHPFRRAPARNAFLSVSTTELPRAGVNEKEADHFVFCALPCWAASAWHRLLPRALTIEAALHFRSRYLCLPIAGPLVFLVAHTKRHLPQQAPALAMSGAAAAGQPQGEGTTPGSNKKVSSSKTVTDTVIGKSRAFYRLAAGLFRRSRMSLGVGLAHKQPPAAIGERAAPESPTPIPRQASTSTRSWVTALSRGSEMENQSPGKSRARGQGQPPAPHLAASGGRPGRCRCLLEVLRSPTAVPSPAWLCGCCEKHDHRGFCPQTIVVAVPICGCLMRPFRF